VKQKTNATSSTENEGSTPSRTTSTPSWHQEATQEIDGQTPKILRQKPPLPIKMILKKSLPILFLLTVILLTTFMYNRRKEQSVLTPEPTPTPSLDETANWKIYRNEDLSFRYPPSWQLIDNNIEGYHPRVTIDVVEKDASFKESLFNECMYSITDVINGLIITRFTPVTTGDMCSTNESSRMEQRDIWIIPHEDVYSPGISFRYSAKEQNEAEGIFNQILSTFRFTNQDESSEKLRVCPDNWMEFLSPIQVKNDPYFGQTGEFMTINGSMDLVPADKFDLDWIRDKCKLKGPEPVG
jgi:hypothetical protein